MSSGGQVFGGIVGAVAGLFLGAGTPAAALYGAQIGMTLGGLIDPPKGPVVNGPRLDDLSVQTSTYGAVIPRVYGTVTVNGNVFWLENNRLKETVTKKKSGGKGGGSKTTTRSYTYSATFAVGLCKGPIVGVRRIWIGPDLIYDAGSSDPNTIAASNAAASGFRLYTGTDTQAADARMQATLGVANTPAWRGLAYLVFYDLALARYANSLAGAQVRVEIMTLAAVYNYQVTARTMASTRAWRATSWNGSTFCSVAFNTNICATSPDGITWTDRTLPITDYWQDIASNGSIFVLVGSTANCYTSPDGITWTARAMPSAGYTTQVEWGGGQFLAIRDSQPFATSPDGITWTAQSAPASGNYGKALAWNGSVWVTVKHFSTGDIMSSPTGVAGSWTSRQVPTGSNWDAIAVKGSRFCLTSSGTAGSYISDDGITWTYYTGGLPSGVNSIASDGSVFIATTQGTSWLSYDGITWSALSMPTTGETWTGITWSGGVFSVVSDVSAHAVTIQPYMVSPSQPVLSAIVSAECLQSGLLSGGDVDVSALTSLVRGYRIGSVGAIRAALEPLQAAWPFDVVQHGYVIRFVARGGTSVVTISVADLDARGAGQEPGVQITTSREMDSQLPRRVTVQHLDYDREYNTGTQYAERLNTAAINARVLDLPIALTATEAAGKAEVLLYLYWLERYDVAVTLPPTYGQLEPGDVVTLVTPDGNVSLRLTAIHYTSDGRLECQAKYASAAIYTPTAVGSVPAVTGPTTITPVGASVYVLLDVPMVSSAQSGPSFLVAMTGALAGWRGGVLMQSTDAGSTWASLQDFGPPGSSMGTCTNSIGVVEHRMVDSASLLNVTLTQGALYSVTQLAMLGGANHFAYGADGRWEIIAAQDCTLVSGTSYVLQNLLRGRFGSEWAMGLHTVG
ncbi:phage tail protein, partial [Tahibacter sp.]|uniref:phage tail protein n=1 Tax=Tahibacter sp. TaxID=2056211 RepID=UPI0028C4C704